MTRQTDSTLVLLQDLVSIDSVNPSLVPGARGEAEVARRVASECTAAGLTVHVTEVAPGRPNIVGVLQGRASGPALMFCGHTDTVGVSGMVAPFDPVQSGGRLYGRGAQDMKGGVAAMLGAARVLTEGGGLASGTLIVAAVVDEEHASLGADALVETWRADAAVVTEPTDLDVAIAHKGFQWLEVETRGQRAHGSRPEDGRDAILRMGRVLSRLESLNQRLRARPEHPLLGTASLHASTIASHGELSSYPAQCLMQMERRTLPGESQGVGLEEVEAILERLRNDDWEFDGGVRLMSGRHPYEIERTHALPRALGRAATSVGFHARRVGMTYWSDAAVLGAAGIPSVLFGPGGAGLHSPEEYVQLKEVCTCRDTLVALARDFMR